MGCITVGSSPPGVSPAGAAVAVTAAKEFGERPLLFPAPWLLEPLLRFFVVTRAPFSSLSRRSIPTPVSLS